MTKQQPPTLGEFLLKTAAFGLGCYGVYKVGQAIVDEEYDSRTLPAPVRRSLIADHVDTQGAWCRGWSRSGHYAPRSSLTIDHIKPYADGGRTSTQNSQVLCRSCNSSKGIQMTLLDMLRGR